MSYHKPGNNGSILHISQKKKVHGNVFFTFDQKKEFYPQNDGMEIKFNCPYIHTYIHPPLSVIWHLNCLWFFEKYWWQSCWLNKPLFIKSHILRKNTDLWNCLLVISSPEYILTYAEKQGSILYASWKKFMTKIFRFMTKKQFFTQKWCYEEKMYKPLNQSIIIHDLTCKLCLVLWKKFITKFWVK